MRKNTILDIENKCLIEEKINEKGERYSRDPKHPYNPGHAFKDEIKPKKHPIPKLFKSTDRRPFGEREKRQRPKPPPPPFRPTVSLEIIEKTAVRNAQESEAEAAARDDLAERLAEEEKKCVCDKCGKEYKYASGLSRHKKQCNGLSDAATITALKEIIKKNDMPSVADLFCELTERSQEKMLKLTNENERLRNQIRNSEENPEDHIKILELTNDNKKLKALLERAQNIHQKEQNVHCLRLRKESTMKAAFNKQIEDLIWKNKKLTAEIDQMREYNENIVLPGVSEFQETTNEKISDLEAEVERLKTKIKAYES
jgi:hypothetical protein